MVGIYGKQTARDEKPGQEGAVYRQSERVKNTMDAIVFVFLQNGNYREMHSQYSSHLLIDLFIRPFL